MEKGATICSFLVFVLQVIMDKFFYIKPVLSFVMVFIGIEMQLVGSKWEVPTAVSLLVLLSVMIIAVVASIIKRKNEIQRATITINK
ncbi:hypothetical protein TW81_06125 [Vibrio galatheae]|uniref:Uncharacterized protein n=1 Tax=Vibrio galatheae TaxID=579748 RepID=A0A0F4NP71_9VIBR|nr:hypothetical protein TW81_06125 [Vibrio galatheae]